MSSSVVKELERQLTECKYEIGLIEEQIFYHQKQINDKRKTVAQLEDRIGEIEMAIENLEESKPNEHF